MPKIILSESDKTFIIDNYANKTCKELSILLGKSKMAINGFIFKKGLKKSTKLTSQEKKFIINNYQNKRGKDISKEIDVTLNQIHMFASKNKLGKTIRFYNTGKNWTDDEIEYLIKNYAVEGVLDIAKKLGKSKYAITSKKWSLKKTGVI